MKQTIIIGGYVSRWNNATTTGVEQQAVEDIK